MKKTKEQKRQRRKLHIRKKVNGTAEKPRIFVFKSNKYFYAGIANDEKDMVITSMMSKKNEKEIVKMAKELAKKASKFEDAVFDRSGYKYHGLVKTFAEELRNNGVNI
jgi:large subunit ribosomal protein L18